ncbi:MAG: bifunctional hydroxymethylpyrimidine kinase/phosphomethylpyrimidine kinase [Candidatus Nitrosocaldaceae archaeon]
MIIKALTIAGSDTSSGAGIQSDLLVFFNLKVYGLSVITALTAQNTQNIISIHSLTKEEVKDQLDAILDDISSINAIKIGMVYDKDIVEFFIDYLKDIDIPIIIDPVLKASTGALLLKEDAFDSYNKLLKLAYVITPNITETEMLTGIKIKDVSNAKEAAKKLVDQGIKRVIITGGHLSKPVDLLYDGEFYEVSSSKIEKMFHGAGTIFSAALTAEIAKGFDIIKAFKIAHAYTRHALNNSYKIGRGLLIPSLFHPIDSKMDILQRAIDMLETMEGFSRLIPESQSNLVHALNDEFLAVKGRIVRFGEYARAGYIENNASKHVANALRIAMKYSNFRSAINIRYDDEIIELAKRLRMSIKGYDRTKEPIDIKYMEGKSIEWGMKEIGKDIPDLVYHKGDFGKEPMIIVFGLDPIDVVNKIGKIATLLKDPSK